MKKEENATHCYNCKKDLRAKTGGNAQFVFSPSFDQPFNPRYLAPDYTCVGIYLNNESREMAFVTPVCFECRDIILKEENKKERNVTFDHLLSMLGKYATGPKDFLAKKMNLTQITDLTQELKDNGVIQCQ